MKKKGIHPEIHVSATATKFKVVVWEHQLTV